MIRKQLACLSRGSSFKPVFTEGNKRIKNILSSKELLQYDLITMEYCNLSTSNPVNYI